MAIPELELAAKNRPSAPYGCLAILTAIAGLAIWGFILLRSTMRQLFEAEERLHATILVCDVVDECLKANRYTVWPRSWDELERTVVINNGPYAWPRDAKEIEAMVTVDFRARLGDIQAQDTETFRAIQPNGPAAWTYKEVGVGPLIEDIRKHRKRE